MTSSRKKKTTSLHITRPYAQHARTIRYHRNSNNRLLSSTSHSAGTAATSSITLEEQYADPPASIDESVFQYDADNPDPPDIADHEPSSKKRKPVSRTNVMQEWQEHRDAYLQEMLRHDGREGLEETTCAECGETGDYSCYDCAYRLHYCQNCLIDRHRLMPFHRIQVIFSRLPLVRLI
jgi:hypothetical protein